MTQVSPWRSPCLTVTHSRWRGDLSRVALAQSCAEAKDAAKRMRREISVMRFMAWLLLRGNIAGRTRTGKGACRTRGMLRPSEKDCTTETRSFFFGGCVDRLACVRYAFEFTQLELSHLRGTDKPPHGRRKASYPRTRFFRVVQPTGPEGAARRLRAGARLHDRAALRLGAVGKHPAGARPPIQGHRPSKRGVSDADSPQLHRQGEAPRRGVFPRACGCYHRRRRRACGTPGNSSNVGDHHRPYVVEVDPVVPGSARAD